MKTTSNYSYHPKGSSGTCTCTCRHIIKHKKVSYYTCIYNNCFTLTSLILCCCDGNYQESSSQRIIWPEESWPKQSWKLNALYISISMYIHQGSYYKEWKSCTAPLNLSAFSFDVVQHHLFDLLISATLLWCSGENPVHVLSTNTDLIMQRLSLCPHQTHT